MKLAGYILDKYYSHVKLCFGYFMHLYAAKINDWPTKFQELLDHFDNETLKMILRLMLGIMQKNHLKFFN